MSALRRLIRNSAGAATVELAFALPILLLMIYGIATIGLVFEANAGMQHALGQGARFATLCPSVTASGACIPPSDGAIVTKIQNSAVGMNIGTFNTPTVTTPASGCTNCRDLAVSYDVTPSFLFFNVPPIHLAQTKRVSLAT